MLSFIKFFFWVELISKKFAKRYWATKNQCDVLWPTHSFGSIHPHLPYFNTYCRYTFDADEGSSSHFVSGRNTGRIGFILWISMSLFNGKSTFVSYIIYIFTNLSARIEYDTRSIFKRSLTGFEFRVFLLLD